ncbi:MAG: hypothetical protein A2Y76_13025 [Planctomycetes bacterium RBG_13_60_9]|nr:MAG: hypothetical protein A2Y76_13025 [Planctomycetes bacterium RBG_13_60_9]
MGLFQIDDLHTLAEYRQWPCVSLFLPAACNGRVRTLFIQRHARTWGTFDPQRLSVETRENPAKGDVDLIDLVTIHVLLHRGKVHAVRRDQMPTDGLQAAIFRC